MNTNFSETRWNGKNIILGKPDINHHLSLHLLIGFHGAESTPENMLVHGNHLNLTNTFLVFPEGPVQAGEERFSWWEDGPNQKKTVESFLTYTTNLINHGYAEIKQDYPTLDCPVSLWGFSQGAAAALVYALLGSYPIHKVASVCGFLPEAPNSQKEGDQRASILGIFGTNDNVVPSFLAEHALEEMKNNGHKSEILETKQGHQLSADNINEIKTFLVD